MTTAVTKAESYVELRERRLAELEDETYRQMLEMRAAMPGLREIGVEKFRSVELPDNELADGVTIRDVEVPGPAGPIPTRIYTPEGITKPAGVYLHLHGGGFIGFPGLDKVTGPISRIAADIPAVIVYPDFRIAPENPFPASIDDCWAVTQWVFASCEREGWDIDRIAVGGGCTGGTFSAAMSLMARDAGGPNFALQFLSVPILDLRCDTESQYENDRFMLSRDDNLYVTEQYLADADDRFDWRASPLLAPSVRGVAPALIVCGEWDTLRDDAVQYANRLTDAGVEVILRVYPKQSHAFSPSGKEREREESHEVIRRFIGPDAKKGR